MKVEFQIEYLRFRTVISPLIDTPFQSLNGDGIYLAKCWIVDNFESLDEVIMDISKDYDGVMITKYEVYNELYTEEEQCRISIHCGLDNWSLQ